MLKHETAEPKSFGGWLFNAIKLIGFILLEQTPLLAIVIPMNLDARYGLSTTANSILAVIGFIFIVFLIWFFWNRYYTYTKESLKKFSWEDLGIAFLFFLAIRIIASVGSYLNVKIYGEEQTANDAAIASLTDQNTFVMYFILFILAIGLLVPMLEELMFRGMFTNLLFAKRMFWLPLIVTSLIFGALHQSTNIISFALYALIGVILFLAYMRRRQIVDSMLVHILHNGVSAVGMLFIYFSG